MSYAFQGMLYQTAHQAAEAALREWATAGGDNPASEAVAFLRNDPRQAVNEMIDGWQLDQPENPDEAGSPSWLDGLGMGRDDLVKICGPLADEMEAEAQ